MTTTMSHPKSSPWGRVQHCDDLAEGVVFVGTAGHGGIKLDRKRNALIPLRWRRKGGWYEEDCEAYIPIFFLKLGDADRLARAEQGLKTWYWRDYEAHFGVTLAPGESRIKDEHLFNEQHRNDWLGVSAFGDWKEGVPKGMVGVLAAQGGCRTPGTPCRAFLVPAAEYQARQFSFVCDPSRHEHWDYRG